MSTDGYGLEKNIEDMLVAELKEILARNNLSTVGKKLELVTRLKDHLNDHQPLKRKSEDNDENGEANKKQKTESSENEEIKDVETNDINQEEEEVEYQEVGIQGEYQENQEYQQENEEGNEDNEEVVVEEVGAGRELYPEEKEEQEEKERNEESQSQEGNDSKEPATALNKIPTLSLNDNRPNHPNQRLPPLRDQIKVALDDKNFEELDKLTKILLSQNDMLNKKLARSLQVNDDLNRNIQAQSAAFGREKYMLLASMRGGAMPNLGRGGLGPAPMPRPPMRQPAMPIPQPQPIRAIPPTGQRYGQVPPLPRPPTNSYALPLAPQQQQSGYSGRPAYSSSYQQPQQQQYQSNHHQNQSSYQQRKSY